MNLTINCPQCGYNKYKAINTNTNQEVTLIISKCENTMCELEIPEYKVYNTFRRIEDLCIQSYYKIIELISSSCLDNSI